MTWVLRRLVIAPLVVLLAVLIWITTAAVAHRLPPGLTVPAGRLRPLRIMWVAAVYLAM